MISFLDVLGHIGTIISCLCVLAAMAAFYYIPSPERHYIVMVLIIGAAAAQIYTEGYSRAEMLWESKYKLREAAYDRNIAEINDAHQKAVIVVEQRTRAMEQANADALRTQLDQETHAREEAEMAARTLREHIAQAPKETDDRAPALILDAVRGHP